MSRAGHQLGQTLGAGDRPFGICRLHRVDVEVAGAGVLPVPLGHRFQPAEQLLGPRLRSIVLGPVVPRAQQHQRLGRQDLRVGIVRVPVRDRPHRPRVRRVPTRAVGARIRAVADRHGLDVGPLPLGASVGPLQRLPDRRVRPGPGRRIHGRVDVRPRRPGDAPPAHRAIGVQSRRVTERADRLRVVERVGEPESLVEVALRLRDRRTDRVVVVPEIVVEPHLLTRFRHGFIPVVGTRLVSVVALSRRRTRQRRHHQGDQADAHEPSTASCSHRGPPSRILDLIHPGSVSSSGARLHLRVRERAPKHDIARSSPTDPIANRPEYAPTASRPTANRHTGATDRPPTDPGLPNRPGRCR